MQSPIENNYSIALLLLLAMGVWAFAMAGHETLGHGGICALSSECEWVSVSAMYFDGADLDGNRISGTIAQVIRAGGSMFNLLIAGLAIMWLWRKSNTGPTLRLVLWLSLTLGLFQSGSYIGFGWLIHPGMDWAILSELLPQPLGHILVSVLGSSIILAGFYFSRRFYPGNNVLKSKIKIFFVPIVACAVVSILASLLVPSDDRWLMIQGGIGNSIGFLFWMIILAFLPGYHAKMPLIDQKTLITTEKHDSKLLAKPTISVTNNGGWIVASSLISIFYTVILGSGLTF